MALFRLGDGAVRCDGTQAGLLRIQAGKGSHGLLYYGMDMTTVRDLKWTNAPIIKCSSNVA